MNLVQQEVEELVDWRSSIMDNGGQCARMDSVQLVHSWLVVNWVFQVTKYMGS